MLSSLAVIFASSFMIALSGALMPGPLLTVTISESSRRGASAGPLMMLGHGLLELVLVVALLSGMAPFFEQDGVFIVIALFGGGILLWMAVSMLRSLPTLRLDLDVHTEKTQNLVMAGIMFSLANPYWTIWWASIGLGYIIHSFKFGIPGVLAFFTGHILADLLWYSLISFAIARGKRFFSDGFYRGLIGTCASLLVVFACYFLYSGLEKLV
ncbi:MAG: LysE family translocator [Proteobacteria bacterium]|nr:LysE family translocator [Pseudomonadota bacterium]